MAHKAKIFLSEGFEEVEALAPYDILTRGGVEVELISITNSLMVRSSHGVSIQASRLITDGVGEYDMLILPGGMPGSANMLKCQPLLDLLVSASKADKELAAICAAPMVLGSLGLLHGHKATCYPGFEDKLSGAEYTAARVERSGKITTSAGMFSATEFGLKLLSVLVSPTKEIGRAHV